MTGHEAQPEWVNKIDVAERQLCGAIRFFFERRDPIIVHALVAAGHQVLTDIGNSLGVIGLLKGKNQSVGDVKNFNYAANFFKHADRDPDGRINIAPLSDLTAEFLMDAVILLQRSQGTIPIEAKIFWSWFVTKHKDLFEGCGEAIQGMIDDRLDPVDFGAITTMLKLSKTLPPEASEED